jgi:formylmethanofuran dehydrogenase subunit E
MDTTAKFCNSCLNTHAVEDDATYCVKCFENFDSGCMNEVNGEPVCFQCGEEVVVDE